MENLTDKERKLLAHPMLVSLLEAMDVPYEFVSASAIDRVAEEIALRLDDDDIIVFARSESESADIINKVTAILPAHLRSFIVNSARAGKLIIRIPGNPYTRQLLAVHPNPNSCGLYANAIYILE